MFLATSCIIAALNTGCLTPSPFRDAFAHDPPVTTPSMEGIQATGAESRLPAGSGELKYVYTADGTVLHRPLYFEDWAEECGSDDDQFAWTGEDFLYILEGPVWFMANAVAFPVEAVINPPWCVMASDCVPGCRRCWLRHDAARWCGCTHQNGPQAAAVAHKEVVE